MYSNQTVSRKKLIMSKISDLVAKRINNAVTLVNCGLDDLSDKLDGCKLINDPEKKIVELMSEDDKIYIGHISYSEGNLCNQIKFKINHNLFTDINNFSVADNDTVLNFVSGILPHIKDLVRKINQVRVQAVGEYLFSDFKSDKTDKKIDTLVQEGNFDSSIYKYDGIITDSGNTVMCVKYDIHTDCFYALKPSIRDWSSLSTVISDLEVSDNHLDQLNYALHHMKEEC